jgi:Cys-tRNA(Pro) deacylase
MTRSPAYLISQLKSWPMIVLCMESGLWYMARIGIVMGRALFDSEEKMGVENVRAYFREQGLVYEIHEFNESTETVELAAQALGVEPALIAKTLALKVKEKGVLVVTRGDARIDNRKFKDQFGVKAKMMSPEEVLEKTGHPVGGVCPFAVKDEMEIYLDASIRQFDKVYPAAGSKNSCIEIEPEELYRITSAQWVDVCQ